MRAESVYVISFLFQFNSRVINVTPINPQRTISDANHPEGDVTRWNVTIQKGDQMTIVQEFDSVMICTG
jgi:hypothetical protein